MEIEAKSKDEKLNSYVAITVVLISVFLAISKLKDNNIVHGMEFVKSDSVDVWNEYQAERIKLHNDENALAALSVVHVDNASALAAEQHRLQGQMKKYTAQSAVLRGKAEAADARYESLDYRHDQFDVEDGFLSVALALTAVSALTEIYWLLATGWGFAAFGGIMGLAGMFGWPLHPEILMRFLT